MGNCIQKDSDSHWGGDYWGSPDSSPETAFLSRQPSRETQIRKVTGDDESSGDRFSSSCSKPTTEVKIKITKKQLQELLCMKEVQGLTVEQMLTQLIKGGGDGVFDFNQRSWRPELNSIPE